MEAERIRKEEEERRMFQAEELRRQEEERLRKELAREEAERIAMEAEEVYMREFEVREDGNREPRVAGLKWSDPPPNGLALHRPKKKGLKSSGL